MGVARQLVAVAVFVPLLFSCSEDEPSPEPEASASTSATSSPSPSPSGPSIPPAAQGTDEASAKAFVRFWFESLSQAMTDGDVAAVRSISAPRCESCTGLIDLIEEVYGKGAMYETEGWKVEQILRAPQHTASRPDFLLRTRHTSRSLIDSSGKVVDTRRGALVGMRIVLVRQDSGWTVLRLSELT